MATKAEHHEWVRKYVKHHTPPTKLSLASLETLAVIAYRQPITVPEIQDVRGVNAVSVLKTLLDKKLITTSGRKNVIGRPNTLSHDEGIPRPFRFEEPGRVTKPGGV